MMYVAQLVCMYVSKELYYTQGRGLDHKIYHGAQAPLEAFLLTPRTELYESEWTESQSVYFNLVPLLSP